MFDKLIRGLTTNVASIGPILLDAALESTSEMVLKWAGNRPSWSVHQTSTDDGVTEIDLIRTTPLFRFKDDISVKLRSLAEMETELTAVSRSRVGRGDLGQNARNLKALQNGLVAEQAVTERSGSR